jgi:CHAT domain-containing protein
MRFMQSQRWQQTVSMSLAILVDEPTAWREAYEGLLAWKGRVTRLAQQSRTRLDNDLTVEQKAMISELRRVQGDLSTLVYRENVTDRATRDERLSQLRDRRNRLELRWQQDSEAVGEAPVTFERFRAALPDRSAVVDFFVQGVWTPAVTEDGESRQESYDLMESDPHLTVWITRRDSETPLRLDLGPAAIIEDAVQSFRAPLVARDGVTGGERKLAAEANAKLLELIWNRIAVHLDDEIDLIFISPDSFVGTLPFETLQPDRNHYLIEKFRFVYLQDVETLATDLAPDLATNVRVFDSLLSVGGVDYERRDEESPDQTPAALNASSTSKGKWKPLAFTLDESRAVHQLFKDGQRTLLLGAQQATEERLKRELGETEYSVLHLATHGFFGSKGPKSFLEPELRGESQKQYMSREAGRRVLRDHPGLLSGLIFSGANVETTDGRDDGYLTAEEVSWLNLSGTHLVVLSACETGLGRAESGEGLIGLRRAFRTAGADSVISSLWNVDDKVTSRLMKLFYENLLQGNKGTLDALRSAQLEILETNRKWEGKSLPKTWGAFVVDGDWR